MYIILRLFLSDNKLYDRNRKSYELNSRHLLLVYEAFLTRPNPSQWTLYDGLQTELQYCRMLRTNA